MPDPHNFKKELETLINKYSMESEGGDTPDFILAQYLTDCIQIFSLAVKRREEYFTSGKQPK